jgi:hypothetical protein
VGKKVIVIGGNSKCWSGDSDKVNVNRGNGMASNGSVGLGGGVDGYKIYHHVNPQNFLNTIPKYFCGNGFITVKFK